MADWLIPGNSSHGRPRWGRGIARSVLVGTLCVVMQLGSPMRAYALFGWLDHLSGPGPFHADEFQFRLLCAMDQPSAKEAVEAIAAAQSGSGRRVNDPLMGEAIRLLEENHKITNEELRDLSKKASAVLQAERKTSGRSPDRLVTAAALERGLRMLREAAVGKTDEAPGWFVWGRCGDNPLKGGSHYTKKPEDDINIRREDRHPLFSLGLNYRFYTTGTYFIYPATRNDNYAHGESIRLHMFEVQASWPLTGKLDILDGQVSVGRYLFKSSGFDDVGGLVVEPVRFDLHFPARWVDRTDDKLLILLYSLSAHWGLMNFPGGFSASAFNATGSAAREISGGEMVFDRGIVLDIGRLFGR